MHLRKLATILALAISSVAAIGIHATHKDLDWLARFGLLKLPASTCPFYLHAGPIVVAHGGGAIGGHKATNSREAIEHSIAAGCKFIEVDLCKTIDGKYFGAHRIKDFNKISSGPTDKLLRHIPPSSSVVRGRRIHGSLTPVFLTEIADILRKNPDVWLVTDKATDYRSLVEQFPMTDRLIVEVHGLGNYIAAHRAGVRYVALGSMMPWDARPTGVRMMVVGRKSAARAIKRARFGDCVMCASYESLDDLPSLLYGNGVFAYVDCP